MLAAEAQILTLSGFTMGTSYQIQLAQVEKKFDQDLLSQQIQQILDHLDKDLFSSYVNNSELSRFNRSPIDQDFPVSSDFIEVLSIAAQIHRESDQHFDITISPLVELWGFGSSTTMTPVAVPTQVQINHALNQLGSDALAFSIETNIISKTKAVQLDFSGIAKGYAVDQIAILLEQQGFKHFLVEIGGELKLHGKKTLNQDWTIAIESPDVQPRSIFNTIISHGQDIAVAGSGDYRNYFDLNGKRYSHQLDPNTGRPISHQLAAVTVITTSAAWADAYATALIILGPEQGFALASSINLAAYFIIHTDTGYEEHYTDAFAPYLPN